MQGGLIDLGAMADDDAQQLSDELLAPDDERQLAFHNQKRFAARLRPAAEAPKPNAAVVFRADASYLISGGLGGLGLAVARWMTERGARHFILTGRTQLPARAEWQSLPAAHPAKSKVDALSALERLGVSVHAPALDVADAGEVKAFVDAFHAEGWPRIRGVIHAAGVVDDQLMLRLDAETFAKVLRPKVAGARALHEATKDLELDFFTLFSSVSAVLGQFGQAHYAAGNAFMDNLAHWRRGQGLPATTINWGPWAEVGLYARMDTTDKAGRSGVFPMLPDQALQAMEYICALAPTQAIVVSADWTRLPPSPLLAEVAPESGAGMRSAEDEQAAAALLLDLLLADPDERMRLLVEYLRDACAHVLRLDPARLDAREPLTSYGMDSIMVVELKNQIEKTMNLHISMVDLFTGSVVKLAEQLAGKLADDTQLEELLSQVENMSPQEIEALLGEGTDHHRR
jgi:NAD(P)-dependent dehydrogenase (short-subunit alcohol dehydrogenase family)/acyl carrier protein